MTDSQRAYDAYAQGHKDACQDTDCVLRPDSTYPSYGQGWADGFAAASSSAGCEPLCIRGEHTTRLSASSGNWVLTSPLGHGLRSAT